MSETAGKSEMDFHRRMAEEASALFLRNGEIARLLIALAASGFSEERVESAAMDLVACDLAKEVEDVHARLWQAQEDARPIHITGGISSWGEPVLGEDRAFPAGEAIPVVSDLSFEYLALKEEVSQPLPEGMICTVFPLQRIEEAVDQILNAFREHFHDDRRQQFTGFILYKALQLFRAEEHWEPWEEARLRISAKLREIEEMKGGGTKPTEPD